MRLLLVLAVVGAAAFAADGAAAGRLEAHAGRLASERVGVPVRVDIPSRPLALHVVRGRLPLVRLDAANVPAGSGAELDRLLVELRDVEVSLASFAARELPAVRGGTFSAVLGAEALTAVLPPSELDAWRIVDGAVEATVAGRTVRLQPAVESGRLTLRGPDGLGVSLPVLQPSGLPYRVVLERVRAVPGALELRGRVDRQ